MSKMWMHNMVCFVVPVLVLASGLLQAAELGEARKAEFEPRVLGPSSEGINAIPTFEVAEGLIVELVAAEPHLANPVAFTIDEQGRFFVAETYRHGQGVLDIRGRAGWPSREFKSRLSPERLANLSEEMLDVDLAVRTVDDRIAYLRKYMGSEVEDLAVATDRVRRLVDVDGDGVVDESSVFVDGFRNIADGIGAGVLARKGQLYYTNIPDLWLFSDYDQDGKPEKSQSLHYGYGVRTGFLGHDLHGLVMGPDGKIYFSIGDRGTHVQTFDGREISIPDTGAVFRCYPDGSKLEVFSTGLRNPQELAFDALGNLFTGDNNSDGGDQARWVYLVEGGDSGWRIGYQFIQRPNARGPWNAEKLWYPRFEGQASYIIPPLANIGNGPSGLAYYPGLGLSDDYNDSFLMVDFKGSKRTSGIHRIKMKASGAGYEVDELDKILWQAAATDVGFGYDGGVYFTDWVSGWSAPGKGRIYRIADPVRREDPRVKGMKALMASGMEAEQSGALRAMLGHPDMRVRMEAQFELADRGLDSLSVFAEVFETQGGLFPRLHAVWGIGQVIDRAGFGKDQNLLAERVEPLIQAFENSEAEVKAQICKVLGDLKTVSALPILLGALNDESARVQYFAALSLGKLGHSEALGSLLELASRNADKDVYLRHAVVMALVGINDLPAILNASNSGDLAVERVSLLALRRLKRVEVSRFLSHSDLEMVREAALAINDVPIDSATTELALLIDRQGLDEPVLRRAINANYRLGTYESAVALARFASDSNQSESLRSEAIEALGDWEGPLGRDRITGVWRPLLSRGRDNQIAGQAVQPLVNDLLAAESDSVKEGALSLIDRLSLGESVDRVVAISRSEEETPKVRAAALRALKKLDEDQFRSALQVALFSSHEALRASALKLSSNVSGLNLFEFVQKTLETGSIAEQRGALTAVRSMSDSRVPGLLGGWLDKLAQKKVPTEILLELIESVDGSGVSSLETKLASFRSSLPNEQSAVRHPELLDGGDPENGRVVFFEKLEVSCVRCHKIGGEGGEAGPDLTGVGSRKDAAYLLESVLYPNRAVAAGFETVVLDLGDNFSVGGIIKEDTAEKVVIITPEDGAMEFAPDEIKGRSGGLSAMPESMKDLLTPYEIRDLVAFLSSLKE
jgi:quinoprotein glucose dehydrogenase